MRAYSVFASVASVLSIFGCWAGADVFSDSGFDEDGGTDDNGHGVIDDSSCGDLAPCVSSDISGYTCPGAPNDVQCWNFSGHCDATKLCASKKQACSIVCGQVDCQEGAGDPPKPVCD